MPTRHIWLQGLHIDEHSEFMHWGIGATLALSVILFGFLATLRFSGWKITAWMAGAIAIVIGITSIAFPTQASSVGAVWGTASLIWGILFIGVTQLVAPDRIGRIVRDSNS